MPPKILILSKGFEIDLFAKENRRRNFIRISLKNELIEFRTIHSRNNYAFILFLDVMLSAPQHDNGRLKKENRFDSISLKTRERFSATNLSFILFFYNVDYLKYNNIHI